MSVSSNPKSPSRRVVMILHRTYSQLPASAAPAAISITVAAAPTLRGARGCESAPLVDFEVAVADTTAADPIVADGTGVSALLSPRAVAESSAKPTESGL